MLKYCIISCVPDVDFLKWLALVDLNVPKDIHFYILRNKPLLKSTIDEVNKHANITMKVVPNENYVNKTMEKGIKFVKLRYDSIMLANPKEDDWIMLGDDDMFFLPEFKDNIIKHYKLFDKIDYGIATHRVISSYTFDSCKFEGLRHGIFLKYKKDIIEEFGSYQDLYGGGEDSLLHEIHYMNGVTKSLRFVFNGIDHIGGNMNRYFDAGLKLINDSRYTVCLVHKLADDIDKNFVKEQNSKCLKFFNEIYLKLQKIEFRTPEEELQLKKYGYTWDLQKINEQNFALFIPAQNWLMPPLFEEFFREDKMPVLKFKDTNFTKKDVSGIQGIINIADTLRFRINGYIASFNDTINDEMCFIFYSIEEDGIYLHAKNKQTFIQEYGNCCIGIKTSIILKVEEK